MKEVANQLLTKRVDVDPESKMAPLNPDKNVLEQCVETGQKILNDPQKLDFFRKLYRR